MDESAYGVARGALNPLPCAFEKALLAGAAGCALASRRALAERETVACTSTIAQANCRLLRALLRERCAFALRLAPGVTPAHAVMMRLQCGGLAGLAATQAASTADVHALVAAAQARHGSLADVDWPGIVAAVAAWRGRARHRDAGR